MTIAKGPMTWQKLKATRHAIEQVTLQHVTQIGKDVQNKAALTRERFDKITSEFVPMLDWYRLLLIPYG